MATIEKVIERDSRRFDQGRLGRGSAFETDGATGQKEGMATIEKVIERETRRFDQVRLGRSSAFSAGFFAGIVLACDVLAILLSGISVHGLYTGDIQHDIVRHFAAVGLFGVLAILVLDSTGLYHFTFTCFRF